MRAISRAAIAVAAAATVGLSGCSSSGSHSATGTGSAASTDSAGSAGSHTPSVPTNSATRSVRKPSDSAIEGAGPASDAGLGALAQKLGCTTPSATRPPKDSGAYTSGVRSAVHCLAAGNEYILVSVRTSRQPAVARSVYDALSTKEKFFYVSGPGWMALGGSAGMQGAPTKADADAVKAKIGGAVTSVG